MPRPLQLACACAAAAALGPASRRAALRSVAAAPALLVGKQSKAIPPIPIKPPPVTEASSRRATRVVAALNAKGFEFYGAYWCRFCDEQRQLLGRDAAAAVARAARAKNRGGDC